MDLPPDIRDAFAAVVVINLARREERLALFQKRFRDWPFKPPLRFPAIEGSARNVPASWKRGPGAWGCMLSHRAVIFSAIKAGASSIFVLEDDACPVANFPILARDFLKKVPDDLDCLMFGGEHLAPPIPLGDGLVRCMGAIRMHAFVLRAKFMPILLQYLHIFDTEHCDIVFASLMSQYKVYAPDPFLIGQDGGPSDTSGLDEPLRFFHNPPLAPNLAVTAE